MDRSLEMRSEKLEAEAARRAGYGRIAVAAEPTVEDLAAALQGLRA